MSASFMRLAWKDAMLVKSLVLLVIGAIAATNAAVVTAYFMNPSAFRDGSITILFWSLFPNLLAFGLPALLIGTEEESGTLGWLRTLPIPRYKVIYSKVLVAIASVAIVWVLSSLTLLLVDFIVPRFDLANLKNQQPFDILIVGYFSTLLLLSGFVTSYAFRSPIAALLAVLPMTLLGYAGFFVLFGSGIGGRQWHWNDRAPLLVASGYLVLLVVVQHRLALRRLRPAHRSTANQLRGYSLRDALRLSTEQNATEYCLTLRLRLPVPRSLRATAGEALGSRPTVTRALLWQAASQQAAPALTLTLLVVAAQSWRWQRTPGGFLAIIAVASMCWLGSMTFYSDTLRRRHFYFAERGLSRSSVWLTRMALPCVLLLVIALTKWSAHGNELNDEYVPFAAGLTGFAIGSLMSMSAARPILGLIVSPVLLAVVLATLGFVLYDYANYWPAFVLATIPILFATWRLLPRWSLGRRGIGFDARVVAYLLLGILLVCVYVVGHRVTTIPAALPEWREAMLAEDTPQSADDPELTNDYLTIRHSFYSAADGQRGDNDALLHEIPKLLDAARKIREAVVRGEVAPEFLYRHVEPDEEAAIRQAWVVQSIRHSQGGQKVSSELLSTVASPSLRRQSREAALTREWQDYQAQSWRDHKLPGSPYGFKEFLGRPVANRHAQYSFERLRADRFVDAATRETLDYLRSAKSAVDVEETKRIQWLWQNVFDMQSIAANQVTPFSLETERSIRSLRATLNSHSR
ncbi:MAG: ABC transporter permease [Planctomycetaceae bacterium]